MTKRIKVRTLLLGGFLTLLFLGLFGRIYWVQVAHASFWAEQARKTWITSKPLPQERGTITDRNGKVLAADADAYTVAVSPKIIHQLEDEHPEWRLLDQIVSKIHLVLNKPESEVRDAVNAKQKDGTYYAQRELNPEGWKIDKEVAQHLMTFRDELEDQTKENDVGLYFEEDQKRYYPNHSLASQVLGYVNKDGNAVTGIEKTMDDVLKGTAGHITYEKDGIRTQLPNGTVDIEQPVDGKNVQLTLDKDIQFYIEQALQETYNQYHPVSITAIAADPKTMDILGMVSLPNYDPNKYWLADPIAQKNNAIQSVYEPGSTFKIVTLAAAIQEGKFDPNATYKSGVVSITGIPIHDSNWVGWGEISYLDGLKHSSNVAFVHLGYDMLGKDKLRQYIDNFGFGKKTGIGLAGEVAGSVGINYPIEVATASFGQGVSVTPIQQIAAVSAVANGGTLMEPHLVHSVTDPKTGKTTVTQPKAIRRVISEETSRKAGDYLEQVVSDQKIGTGRAAYIPGYRIAGKTGTAQVVVNGGYSDDRYVVSFIGYAPVEDPKIALYVLVDRPDVDFASGGAIAGPAFKKIMQQSLLHLGVLPKLDASADGAADKKDGGSEATPGPVTANVPDVTGKATAAAQAELTGRSFSVQVIGKGDKVLQQLPRGGSVLPTSQTIYLLTEKSVDSVPDLTGMSLRDALEMCSLMGASCQTEGEGYVTAQTSAKTNGSLTVTLTLAPPGKEDEAADDAGSGKNADGEGGKDGDSEDSADGKQSSPE